MDIIENFLVIHSLKYINFIMKKWLSDLYVIQI